MSKIIRQPHRAAGGITPEEREQMRPHADLWIKRAMRTDPIEPDKITAAIQDLYAAAGLKRPRVVIAPSPLVAVFAYAAAASLLKNPLLKDKVLKKRVFEQTRAAATIALYDAMDEDTRVAVQHATFNTTASATQLSTEETVREAVADVARTVKGHPRAHPSDPFPHPSDARDTASMVATVARQATENVTDYPTREDVHEVLRDGGAYAVEALQNTATHDALDDAAEAAEVAAAIASSPVVSVAHPTQAVLLDTDEAVSDAADLATRGATQVATDELVRTVADNPTRIATYMAVREATGDVTAARIAVDDITRGAVTRATLDAVDETLRDDVRQAAIDAGISNSATSVAATSATGRAAREAPLVIQPAARIDSATRGAAARSMQGATDRPLRQEIRAAVAETGVVGDDAGVMDAVIAAGRTVRSAIRGGGEHEDSHAVRHSTVVIADEATAAIQDATDYDIRLATYEATTSAIMAATVAIDATINAVHEAVRDVWWTVGDLRGETLSGVIKTTDNETRVETYRVTAMAGAFDAMSRITEGAVYEAAGGYNLQRNPFEIGAAQACFALAGQDGLSRVADWSSIYHGGNMWAAFDCYLTAMRDIIGLRLPAYEKYEAWERAAIHGGFRFLHQDFCIVSDFPETLKVDDQNRPHCEDGPSHRWRDGWSLYHWHGATVPARWIMDRASLTAAEVIATENLETRRAGCEMLGWAKILAELDADVIDSDPDPVIGTLLEVRLPGLNTPARFLKVRCGTGRDFMLGVPRHIKTALDAQAWLIGLPKRSFVPPETRA